MPDISLKLLKCLAFSRANFLLLVLFSSVLLAISPFLEIKTHNLEATPVSRLFFIEKEETDKLASFQNNTFLPISEPALKEKTVQRIKVVVTGYSSTPWQTDETPFVTAAGTCVRNGIVAANFLAFGTKIKLPEIYGDAIFVVEDRMHPRKYYQVDIWFPDYWQAKDFGVKTTYVEILEN